ncbi:D-tyrosyl-tRNA(Tyr) deacylase [Kocuria coralli]|uniref:D-aminoacyl-tRNA deacylase n=1 Tax=Kocuria coralli TaxID=1461025 RepID=A0A5J5KZJ7_9MICC|nr:D-aminoacyl-tRNA deacylase [Kocuria coralli]KAA9395104.1 D-tyrosyl-tRNA(Tyr) deacylase [Kocuria coralli]
MRIVLQRVQGASVTAPDADGRREVTGEFTGPGLVAFVGVTHGDDEATARLLADKTAGLRLLEITEADGTVRGELSCLDAGAPVLAVSQFTLYADCRRGRRPSWSRAAPGEVSEPLVEAYVRRLRELGIEVPTGRFGADMRVSLVNDGPVTIVLDSDELSRPRKG